MPRQREHERNIWESLLLQMTASTTEELMAPLNIDVSKWSDAEWEKYADAYENVETEIDRRARHRRVTKPPAPHTRKAAVRS